MRTEKLLVFNLEMLFIHQVLKKLAGASRGSAQWVTNVGNEFGQIVVSILTSKEGDGLTSMISGLAKRYEDAQVKPPHLLYTDRDCCDEHHQSVKSQFYQWPDLEVSNS